MGLLINQPTAWTTWTPTWTNLTLGNGVVTARFFRVGNTVDCRVNLVFGNTTAVTGDIQFSLPVTAAVHAGLAGLTPLGMGRAYDASAGFAYEGTLCAVSTTLAALRFHLASGTYVTAITTTNLVPFTWTTSDEIATQFRYEAG